MKRKSMIIISFLFIYLLNGCATSNKNASVSKFPIEKKYKADDINIVYMNKKGQEYKNLRQIDRTHTIGLASAKVGMFALSVIGGLSGVSIPSDNIDGFSKNDLIGNEIKDAKDSLKITTPLSEISQALSQNIKDKIKKNPILSTVKYEYPLVISQKGNTWKLVYDSLSGDQNNTYKLDSNIQIKRLVVVSSSKDPSIASNIVVDETCSYVSKPTALEKWKENDYQLVADTKKIIINECIQKISSSYDKFFPLPESIKAK